MTLSNLSDYMALAYIDLRTIHFNVKGDEFYTYHALAEDLYRTCEDYYDDLVETSINNDEYVGSLGTSAVRVDNWTLIDPMDFDTLLIDDIKELIYNILVDIYNAINDIDDCYDSFVYSKLDSMKEYFDKEIYKIKQALK